MNRIEVLGREHGREGFDCGSEPLNVYLRQTARQHAERGISRTFVLVDEAAADPKPIRGFFTLNICQIRGEQLPPEAARRFPREISGVKLARLAVDKAFQERGVGKLLLISAMKKVTEVFESAGGIGLFVDAKDERAKPYYERFGFVPLPDNPLQMFMPLQTIRAALASR